MNVVDIPEVLFPHAVYLKPKETKSVRLWPERGRRERERGIEKHIIVWAALVLAVVSQPLQ